MNLTASEATRNAAFHQHRDSGKLGAQQTQIMIALHRDDAPQDISSKELSGWLGIERTSVTARLNELVSLGYLEWSTPRKCSCTGKTITPVRIRRGQGSLF